MRSWDWILTIRSGMIQGSEKEEREEWNVQEALFAQRNIVTRFLAKIMSLLKCRYYLKKNIGCCGAFCTHSV